MQQILEPLTCFLHFGTFGIYLDLIPFVNNSFLQFPHEDQYFSKSENLNVENFLNTQGNVQLKTFFIHWKNYNQTFKASWKMGKKWLMHLKHEGRPLDIGFMKCAIYLHLVLNPCGF